MDEHWRDHRAWLAELDQPDTSAPVWPGSPAWSGAPGRPVAPDWPPGLADPGGQTTDAVASFPPSSRPARSAPAATRGAASSLHWPPAGQAAQFAAYEAATRDSASDASPDLGDFGDLGWLLDNSAPPDSHSANTSLDSGAFSVANGAPPKRRGRFAAEWSAPGTSSRSSCPQGLLPERGRRVKKDGGAMARRALLERSEPLADDEDLLPDALPPSAEDRPVAPRWRGSGGRWLVWVGRAVLWAVILLVGYRGIVAIADGNSSSGNTAVPPARNPAPTRFPVSTAQAYAVEFGDVYLTFSPGSANARSKALANFLAPGSDPQLGWNGAGSQRVVSDQVASISVTSAHTAIVTLLARLASGRLLELGVPVYAANGAMSVSGNPALLPPPGAAALPSVGQPSADQAATAALQSQLPAFFQAYAGRDQATLARFAAPGAHLAGLNGAVSFGAITGLYVPSGGARRQISVTVTWQLATGGRANRAGSTAATLPMTYQMTIVRQGGSWDVQSIGAATQGPP